MTGDPPKAAVVAVSRKAAHGVDKPNQLVIRLVEGHGVEGDAHHGVKVRHRSRVRQDPDLVDSVIAATRGSVSWSKMSKSTSGRILSPRWGSILRMFSRWPTRIGRAISSEITCWATCST